MSKHVPPRGNPAAVDVPPRTLVVKAEARYTSRSSMRQGASGLRQADKRARAWLARR